MTICDLECEIENILLGDFSIRNYDAQDILLICTLQENHNKSYSKFLKQAQCGGLYNQVYFNASRIFFNMSNVVSGPHVIKSMYLFPIGIVSLQRLSYTANTY